MGLTELACVIAALPVKASPQWDIAVCARFYYPVNDKRKSKRRYYLMSLDGKRKKEIGSRPLAAGEVSFITWKDRNHVMWLQYRNNRVELVELSLRSGSRHTLAYSRWTTNSDASNMPAPIKRWINAYSPEPKASAAKVVVKGEDHFIQVGPKAPPLRNANTKWTITNALNGLMAESWLTANAILPLDLEDQGAYKEWRLYGAGVGLSAHESLYHLFRVNQRQGLAQLIPADVVAVKTRPSRDLWIGVSERDLGSYTAADVWTNALSVGKISSGDPKKILSGRVWISGFSLRP